MRLCNKNFSLLLLLFLLPKLILAQESSNLFTSYIKKSYFEVSGGYINYPFSQKQLNNGFFADKIEVRHPAVRLVLMGYEITPNLHAQVTYMRPIWWVKYHYGDGENITNSIKCRTVWMNVGTLTLKPVLPLSERTSLYAEAGLGVVTRHGFDHDDGRSVVDHLNFATITSGAGLIYNISNSFGVTTSFGYTFNVTKNNQPPISYIGAGIISRSGSSKTSLDKSRVRELSSYRWLSISYGSNIAGYGVNEFFKKAHLFWGGDAEVREGVMVSYHKNIHNSGRFFSLDLGVNTAFWKTKLNNESLFALSLYPVFRFNIYDSKYFSPYLFYVLGGPTYLSHSFIDGNYTGKKFTFYDALGLGCFVGAKKRDLIEIKIAHYSNGNIFPMNCGVKIPLTISYGRAF